MIKKIFSYIIGILLLIMLFQFIGERYLISDCPKFFFNDIDFEICNKIKHESRSVNLIPVDTIYKNKKYIFLFDPVFVADYDTVEKWLNICIGAEEINYDSIIKIDLFIIHESNEYNITKAINQLSSDLKLLFNEKEVDHDRGLLSLQDFYNELNSGYGDFYHSLFDLWAFEFKIGTEVTLKGNITLRVKLVFTDGKTLKHSKKYFLKN